MRSINLFRLPQLTYWLMFLLCFISILNAMEVIVEAMRQSDIILICTVMKLFCISKKYSNLLGEVRLYFFKWAK